MQTMGCSSPTFTATGYTALRARAQRLGLCADKKTLSQVKKSK
jgi:hypothetical protein